MNVIDKVIKVIQQNSNVWLESPRKDFFGGKSLKAKRFKLSFNPKTDKVIFEFESGTRLGIEMWRIVEAIEFLKNHDVVGIGGRISEECPVDSLEGHLKEMAKTRYGEKQIQRPLHILWIYSLWRVLLNSITLNHHQGERCKG